MKRCRTSTTCMMRWSHCRALALCLVSRSLLSLCWMPFLLARHHYLAASRKIDAAGSSLSPLRTTSSQWPSLVIARVARVSTLSIGMHMALQPPLSEWPQPQLKPRSSRPPHVRYTPGYGFGGSVPRAHYASRLSYPPPQYCTLSHSPNDRQSYMWGAKQHFLEFIESVMSS